MQNVWRRHGDSPRQRNGLKIVVGGASAPLTWRARPSVWAITQVGVDPGDFDIPRTHFSILRGDVW
jgi:hypothetical protein